MTLKTIRNRPSAVYRSAPRVDARLDGLDLGGHLLRKEDALYSWNLPEDMGSPRIGLVTLRVDTWRPFRYLPTPDRRRLGLMLEWIKLEYGEPGE